MGNTLLVASNNKQFVICTGITVTEELNSNLCNSCNDFLRCSQCRQSWGI
jgi:hypothetical protein